jgi:hypothetical protein
MAAGHNIAQASYNGFPGSSPVHIMWDFWWTIWHWSEFFSKYFGFPYLLLFKELFCFH